MIILRQKNYTSLKPDFIGNLELIANQANNAFPNEKGVGIEVVYQKNSRLGIRCEIYFGWDDVDYVHVLVMSNNQMYDEYGQKKLNEQELKDLLLTSISGMQKENIPGTKNKLKFLYDQIKALPTRGSVTQKSYSEGKEDKKEKKGLSTGKKIALAAGGAALATGAVIGGKKAVKALKSKGKKVIKDRIPASRQIESKVKGEYVNKKHVTPDGTDAKIKTRSSKYGDNTFKPDTMDFDTLHVDTLKPDTMGFDTFTLS